MLEVVDYRRIIRDTPNVSTFSLPENEKTVVDISFVYVPEIADDLPSLSLSVYLYIVTDSISSDSV